MAECKKDDIQVTINRPARVIHFCDGIEEDIEQEVSNELNTSPTEEVDPQSLGWMPWFSYYAWKSSSKMLDAVDYAGEGLANFLGITTPKYQIEINEYERMQEEKKKLEDESVGWVPKNVGGDIPLVLTEPPNATDKSENN